MTFPAAVTDRALHTEPNGLFIGKNGQWNRRYDDTFIETKTFSNTTDRMSQIELTLQADEFIELNGSFSAKADGDVFIALHNASGKLMDGVEWSRGVWTADSGNSGQGTADPVAAWGRGLSNGILITPGIGNWYSGKDRMHFLEIKMAPTLSEERCSLGFKLFTTDPNGAPYFVTGAFLFAMHVSWVKKIGIKTAQGLNNGTMICRYK